MGRQLDLIRAHPDLAGKAAIAGELTDDSETEQASAGLGSCSPDEYARFKALNDAYRSKFGFPFVMAVRNKSRNEILEARVRECLARDTQDRTNAADCPGSKLMPSPRNPFREWIRLEQPRLGTRVTHASDEFFAAKERLIQPADPVFIEDKYDDHGKWMDGWESRRRRTPGHDHCIIRLGVPGVVHGIDIDTRYFTGNFPPQASVDACVSNEDIPDSGWTEIVPRTDLAGDQHHFVEVSDRQVWTHLKLNIYPDGGIARLRIYGEVRAELEADNGVIDLFALRNGGRALAASDEHYGSMHNLNLPGRGVNMGDGWETARRRGPGNDWVIVALGRPGVVERVEVDTAHFKGNYPDRVSVEAALFEHHGQATVDSDRWQTLLPEAKLQMDQQHYFEKELEDHGPVSHVRMSIYPDGGVSRLRIFGRAESGGAS
jgi:allantoicase